MEIVERFVDGEATDEDLDRARYRAEGVLHALDAEISRRSDHIEELVRKAGWAEEEPLPSMTEVESERDRRACVYDAARIAEWVAGNPLDYQYPTRFPDVFMYTRELVEDIFGNPFHPVSFDPAWGTDTVVAIAQGMYESRDFSAMPILADALQDAGCEKAAILTHCRDASQSHVRGCWVVDLVLGKS